MIFCDHFTLLVGAVVQASASAAAPVAVPEVTDGCIIGMCCSRHVVSCESEQQQRAAAQLVLIDN
jgi:hypothetical protein